MAVKHTPNYSYQGAGKLSPQHTLWSALWPPHTMERLNGHLVHLSVTCTPSYTDNHYWNAAIADWNVSANALVLFSRIFVSGFLLCVCVCVCACVWGECLGWDAGIDRLTESCWPTKQSIILKRIIRQSLKITYSFLSYEQSFFRSHSLTYFNGCLSAVFLRKILFFLSCLRK